MCGLVVEVDTENGLKASCPRCSSVLFKSSGGMLNTLLLGISALMLSVPAATYPFLVIYISDEKSSATLMQTAHIMFIDGFGIAGAVILFTALVFPMCYLILIVYVAFGCVAGIRLPMVWKAVRAIDLFDYFQMTDVFLVGILVSIVKLIDMAEVSFGSGFYFLIAMTVLLISAGSYYDKRLFWCRVQNAE